MTISTRSLNGVDGLILSIKLETWLLCLHPNKHLLILNLHGSVVASAIFKRITQFEDVFGDYGPRLDF